MTQDSQAPPSEPAASVPEPSDPGAGEPAESVQPAAAVEPAELVEPAVGDDAPPRRSRLALALAVGGGAIGVGLVAAVGLAAMMLLSEDPPAVGDCLTDSIIVDDMSVVDCDSAEAYWQVIGEDGVWTHSDFEATPVGEVCAAYPSTLQALWITNARSVTDDTEGDVVCLEPVHEPAPQP